MGRQGRTRFWDLGENDSSQRGVKEDLFLGTKTSGTKTFEDKEDQGTSYPLSPVSQDHGLGGKVHPVVRKDRSSVSVPDYKRVKYRLWKTTTDTSSTIIIQIIIGHVSTTDIV